MLYTEGWWGGTEIQFNARPMVATPVFVIECHLLGKLFDILRATSMTKMPQ